MEKSERGVCLGYFNLMAQCPTCKGRGTIKCTKCDGIGITQWGGSCGECKGKKRVHCDNCGGSGDANRPAERRQPGLFGW